MPNPVRKHTRHRTSTRRAANWRVTLSALSKCSHCGQMTPPHRVCAHCGFYGGVLVVPKKVKKSRKTQEGENPQENEGTK